MSPDTPRYLVAGVLRRQYSLLSNGEAILDAPGGNLLYTAAGIKLWEPDTQPGLIARVGEDYPRAWIQQFADRGTDVRGVHILPEAVDLRYFTAFTDQGIRHLDDPVSHFARRDLPFPRALLGYTNPIPRLDSRTNLTTTSLRQADIPDDFLDATAAHLCPVDYLTHSMLPAVLRQAEFTTITVDPSPAYMNPTFWDHIPALINGLTAFMPSEEEARHLFQGRSEDLWEMAEALAAYGCEIIVVKRGQAGQLVYDGASRQRYEVPAYDSNMVDPLGAGDAFCGGFLAGYRRNYDPVEAALHGSISASMTVEGSDPFYALGALPGLAAARLESLRHAVHRA
jgi:sugar/nucleoside kinase (ribokinase family)